MVKDPQCPGNRGVLHFGQDGGKGHDGTVYLAFNTIVTAFISPVVDLSAPKAKAHLVGNLVSDGGTRQSGQKIAAATRGARLQDVTGAHNWFSGDFAGPADTGLDPQANRFRRAPGPLFADPARHDYRLRAEIVRTASTRLSADALQLPPVPGVPESDLPRPLLWQYQHPAGSQRRPAEADLTLGAYAREGQ